MHYETFCSVKRLNETSCLPHTYKTTNLDTIKCVEIFYREFSTYFALVCLFENNNKKNARNGMTVSEIASTTNLTSEEVYEAMNHLDIKLNDYSEEERWFIMHTDTIPLLMLLT